MIKAERITRKLIASKLLYVPHAWMDIATSSKRVDPESFFCLRSKLTDGSYDELSWPFAAFAFGAVCLAPFGEDRQRPRDGTSGRGRGRFAFAF